MTSMQGGTEILKVDRRGRVRTTTQRRQELLREFDESGLSAPKFAELTGVKYQTLAGWLHRRKKQSSLRSASAHGPAVQWLEAVMEKAQGSSVPSSSVLMVRLPSQATLEVSHLAQAALAGAVLRAWEKAAC